MYTEKMRRARERDLLTELEDIRKNLDVSDQLQLIYTFNSIISILEAIVLREQ